MYKKRILLCEDDQILRNTLRFFLQHEGHWIADFENADQVLSLESSDFEDVDILVTDIEMPGTNGLELAKQIMVQHPSIKIVLMSGKVVDHVQLSQMPVEFLDKPFSLQELLAVINQQPTMAEQLAG